MSTPGSWRVRPGPLEVRFGEPIPAVEVEGADAEVLAAGVLALLDDPAGSAAVSSRRP